jgi:hypothetical protein
MSSLSIIASENDYQIFDTETQEIIIKGFSSYKDALIAFERLSSLKTAFAHAQKYP